MWILMYTWDTSEECQHWQERRFESAYEAEQEAMSLMDDGVAIVRVFKESFNR
jgi:hypothetical protein